MASAHANPTFFCLLYTAVIAVLSKRPSSPVLPPAELWHSASQ
jgi:hypothetical protein